MKIFIYLLIQINRLTSSLSDTIYQSEGYFIYRNYLVIWLLRNYKYFVFTCKKFRLIIFTTPYLNCNLIVLKNYWVNRNVRDKLYFFDTRFTEIRFSFEKMKLNDPLLPFNYF